MIDWKQIEDLPKALEPGTSFLFCTLAQHIYHVTLVAREGETLCWSTAGGGSTAPLLLDSEMAMVTHYADIDLPEASERQVTAVAVRVANLDGRGLAYEHDRYGR